MRIRRARTRPPHERARKRFGQHFLHDRGVHRPIVRAIDPQPGERLVEIGPGRARSPASCWSGMAHARRRRVRPRPRRIAARTACGAGADLALHEADALEFDFATLARARGTRLRVVGNLPYNISTPLLFHVLEHAEHIRDMHFMLQKEVVDRMAAAPAGKTTAG